MLMDLGFVMDEPKKINSTKLLDSQSWVSRIFAWEIHERGRENPVHNFLEWTSEGPDKLICLVSSLYFIYWYFKFKNTTIKIPRPRRLVSDTKWPMFTTYIVLHLYFQVIQVFKLIDAMLCLNIATAVIVWLLFFFFSLSKEDTEGS